MPHWSCIRRGELAFWLRPGGFRFAELGSSEAAAQMPGPRGSASSRWIRPGFKRAPLKLIPVWLSSLPRRGVEAGVGR
jgi:hypothetical protein